MPSKYDEINLLTEAARCMIREGRTDVAIETCAIATALAERGFYRGDAAAVSQHIAVVLAEAGQTDEAERMAERAVAVCMDEAALYSARVEQARRALDAIRAAKASKASA